MNGTEKTSSQEPIPRGEETHFQTRHSDTSAEGTGAIKTTDTSDKQSGIDIKKVILAGVVTGITFFGVSAIAKRVFK